MYAKDVCPQRPQEGIESPRTGVPGSCEIPGCWEVSLGSLGEQKAIFTAEPYLQHLVLHSTKDVSQARHGSTRL